MDEKKELLKKMGWSEELIEMIFSPEHISIIDSLDSHYVITPSETISTDLNLGIRNPIITSGIYLQK